MVRSASGTISTSWWHPSASAKRVIPPGMIQRRMWPLPRGARTTSRRRAPNRPSLEMSMGWTSSGVRLREPLGDVLRLHDHLAVDLPRAVLLEEGVELVLGEPELVHEAVLGGEDVRRSEEHTSELQSRSDLVCRLLLEKKKKKIIVLCNCIKERIIVLT